MEYKGIPVVELHRLWVEQEELKKRREEAGKLWDKTYRDKHREERNQKAKEYYRRKKETAAARGPPTPAD